MSKIDLLSGTAIKTEKGYFYIKNSIRMSIPSKTVVDSWRFYRIVKTSEAAVKHYPVVGKLGFRDGTLIWCIADAKFYLIESNKLVHVVDPQTIKNHGLRRTDAYIVSKSERDLHRRKT